MSKPLYININQDGFYKVHETKQIAPGVNVDFSKGGKCLGVEILYWKTIDLANQGLQIENV